MNSRLCFVFVLTGRYTYRSVLIGTRLLIIDIERTDDISSNISSASARDKKAAQRATAVASRTPCSGSLAMPQLTGRSHRPTDSLFKRCQSHSRGRMQQSWHP